MQLIPLSKYNFPSLLEILHCEMYTIHLNCQIEYLLCHVNQVERVMPFLLNEFDHDSPSSRKNLKEKRNKFEPRNTNIKWKAKITNCKFLIEIIALEQRVESQIPLF